MFWYENIKNRRLMLGWTQQELAQKVGYTSASTIAKIETGVNDITQSKIQKFAEVLGLTISELMGFSRQTEYLTESERAVFENYRALNDEGKYKVAEYAADLRESAKYKK